MIKRHLQLLALVVGGLLSASVQATSTQATSTQAQTFSKIFVFGDSLSDRGNLAALSVVPGQEALDVLNRFPFDQGFSNPLSPTEPGRRAVEVLADALKLPISPSKHTVLLPQRLPSTGNNFAVAGASASGLLANGQSDLPPFLLDTQLAAFDLAATSTNSPTELNNALYVVALGGNDVRAARDALPRRLASNIINTAVNKLDAAIRHLAQQGGRAFLVLNAPDIGSIPESELIGSSERTETPAMLATRLSETFNLKLKKALRKTRKQLNVNIVEFDLFQFFRSVIKNGRALGFDNTRNACVDNPLLAALPPAIPGCLDKLERFVFFDEVHPSNHVQRRVGRALYAVVPELPASSN